MYSVSILVPIYNAERYIERCVRSLFEQTYENLEFVFVDDCSPDASISILNRVVEEYPARKSQMKLIRNESNRGASASKNIAVENATGEFVCFVDSDDWIELNAVELLVSEQLKTDADVVWGRMLMHTDKGVIELGEPSYLNKDEWVKCYCRLTTGIVMTNSRRIIRRELLIRFGIRSADGFNYAEDKLFMSQVAYYANGFSMIDDYVYNYNRLNELSATAKQGADFNPLIFQQESGSIRLIESFFSDKEEAYYSEVGRARMRYLKNHMDWALQSSSCKGFKMIVEQIESSCPMFWDEIGWNSWKRPLYKNYCYMKYFSGVKSRVKHLLRGGE